MKLKAYIEANLANGLIQGSSSPAAEPVRFEKMKDGRLSNHVECPPLNLATVTNCCLLRLISEMLDGGCEARILRKLDHRGAWIPIWINEADKYKTAFRTHYGQFNTGLYPSV